MIKFSDIAYNFLIGGDGNIYEGILGPFYHLIKTLIENYANF